MKFNIEPQELQGMISHLSQFASSMGQISSSMRSYANQLGASWKDPQYIGFIDQIQSIGNQLKTSEESLKQMETQLKVLKQNLERAHSEYSRLR
ncbi:MAG: WXG100 family type VII secretion target [Methylotenera sp.]